MEYTWRPWQPTSNFCPVCSNSHFPFCPPPPSQYFRPPPPREQFFASSLPPPPPLGCNTPPPPHLPYMQPPPPPPLPYDPIAHQQGGPPVNHYRQPAAYIPARPWTGNPSSSSDYYGNSNNLLDSDGSQIGVKRMRVETLADDERRLKLIRDHGTSGHGFWSVRNPRKFGEGSPIESIDDSHIGSYHNATNETLAYSYSTYSVHKRKFPSGNWELNNQVLQSNETQKLPNSGNSGIKNQSFNANPGKSSPGFKGKPSLSSSPALTLLEESPRFCFSNSVLSSPTSGPSSLFPFQLDSAFSSHSPHTVVSDVNASAPTHYSSNASSYSSGFHPKETQGHKLVSDKSFNSKTEEFHPGQFSLEKPKVIDASYILKHPYRGNRPDHIVIILRGLPGSGKSYLAKFLRDLEVENLGTAPRIHSMDEYFMTEVEKVEEVEDSRSSGRVKGKKMVKKKVMEYFYEPEMEEIYRSSMLRAFKKTLDEGAFPFIIVDDRNLREADFSQFWATAKRSGYEVYILEATYKDPAGCAARNVHGFTQDDIQKMANQWEEASSLYLKLDAKSLLHGDDLEVNGIQEVDMDTEDEYVGDPSGSECIDFDRVVRCSEDDIASGLIKVEQKGDTLEEHSVEVVKELEKSKWSNDLDDDDSHKADATGGNSSGLSVSIKPFSKKGKSVRWADKTGSMGFSIGGGKIAYASLIIGPGSGYNLKSNPLLEEEKLNPRNGESRRRNAFQQQLRAEHDSFRAVFDKRKHRNTSLNGADEPNKEKC